MQVMFPIKSLGELENLSREVKWQYFEKLVAFIFAQNDFEVRQNFVLAAKDSKGKDKRQFDVIAKRFGMTFVVECKKWKKDVTAAAVGKHLERCEFYAQQSAEAAIPIIVTLQDYAAEIEGVPVVPIMKLNAFLNGFMR